MKTPTRKAPVGALPPVHDLGYGWFAQKSGEGMTIFSDVVQLYLPKDSLDKLKRIFEK